MVQKEAQHLINIRLAKPYLGNKKNIIALFKELLSNGFLTQGKYVAQFEKQIADYLGVKHAIAVSSGTAALHLSLIALGIDHGDEVIVPAYSFPATANVVELVGAKPVFVDVDLDTYNIDVKKIEEAISCRTRVIIPVHLFGNPADMDLIMKLAKLNNLAVIEDAAGALGSEYKGKKTGTIGNLGCFSFHPRKIITTGEGGMVVTNDDNLAEKIRALRNHGMQVTEFKPDFIAAGFNYRMNEIEAVLGISQFCEIEKIITERQKLAELYMDFLKDIPGIVFQKTLPNSTSVWQAFVVHLKNTNVSNIIDSLKKVGIETNIGTYALHMLKFYSHKYGYKTSDYQNAAELYMKALTLPFYNGMTKESIKQVRKKIKAFLNENRAI